eukprot:3591118-Pyramimonas_sp.AAC.1
MTGHVAPPQGDLQGVRQCRFPICLPTQNGPYPAPAGPVATDQERGSYWAVRLAQAAQECTRGELHGELPTRHRPG